MLMRALALVLTLGLVSVGSASLFASSRHTVPEARETGKPESCIQLHNIQETRVRNDKVIDFRVSGNKWYRNTLPYECPSLGFEERFLHETSLNQLCSVDIITVLHNYGGGINRGASCGLGQFQPVELVKHAKN
jgi:hypothetical protein